MSYIVSLLQLSFLEGVCNYEAFESRGSTLNKIMEALRDDNVYSIGVVGIGGVGKTTLVKQVAHQAMQHHLFTKQLYFDLSWTRHSNKLPQRISEIQRTIAEMIGWQFERHWFESRIAVELKKRLTKEKILIILDDMWKEINLEKIGIPSCKDDDDGKQCKIVFTCRDEELLCKEMGVQICFSVATLPSDEAWTLFKKTTSGGDCDNWGVVEKNNPEVMRSIAKKVVEECEGLPMAVVTIAKALKDETLQAVWKICLEQLSNGVAGKKVYSCVEWSYTHMKDGDDLKSLFLLCASLRYGYISMDHLLQYAIGMDFFDRFDTLEQARNRLLASVEILKVLGWLLEGHKNENRQFWRK